MRDGKSSGCDRPEKFGQGERCMIAFGIADDSKIIIDEKKILVENL